HRGFDCGKFGGIGRICLRVERSREAPGPPSLPSRRRDLSCDRPGAIAARSHPRTPTMAATDKSRTVEDLPADLLPILRASNLLPEKRFDEIKARVRDGSYPFDSMALAQRLVRDKVLTEYQARRLLSNKPQNLRFGNRYVILDRLGSGSMGRVYK